MQSEQIANNVASLLLVIAWYSDGVDCYNTSVLHVLS